MKKNDEITLTIEDLSVDGAGIGRYENIVVFVPFTLPGEAVRAKIIKLAKNHVIGKLCEIVTPSDNRMQPPCPYFYSCGGCTLQHLKYSAQLEYKQNHVKNCMERIGGIDVPAGPTVASPKEFHYRNKASLPFGMKDGMPVLGLYKHHSHEINSISNCLLQDSIANSAIDVVLEFVRKHNIPVYDETSKTGILRHLLLRVNSKNDLMLGLVVNANKIDFANEFVEFIRFRLPRISTIVLNHNTLNTNVILGTNNSTVFGSGKIDEWILNNKFSLSLNSFFQVNTKQTEYLYKKAFEYANFSSNDTLLDLYCGVGTIGICAAKYVKSVFGLEIVQAAIGNANENVKLNGIQNAKYVCGDVSDLIKHSADCDIVIADPPRGGLNSGAIRAILNLNPKKLVYISCNPSTLARDLAVFNLNNYSVEALSSFDMFPQTTHVECVALLTRANC